MASPTNAAVLEALEVARAPLTRAGVRELSARLAKQGAAAGDLAGACLEKHGADACAALLYAGALAGQKPRANDVAPLVAGMSDPILFATLLGASEGDRFGALLDAVESGRAPDEREALALFLAVHLRPKGDPPARLRTLLRKEARRRLDEEPAALVYLAATELKDADVLDVAKPWERDAQYPEYKKLDKDLRRALEAPIDQALPEFLPPKVTSGITVRRVVEKVGRNDPCPCGSGKKYKKCCEGKDAAQAGALGMSRSEYVAQVATKLTAEDLQAMRADDLEKLDFTSLGEVSLIVVMRRLAAFSRWEAAERALAAVIASKDRKEVPDAYRCDLIASALAARNFEVAERIQKTLDDPKSLPPGDALSLELRAPTAETIAHMEELAIEGLEDEPKNDALIELAYAVLDHYPALGILVARAGLSADRPRDSNAMLEHIEDARDLLGLPPRDPSWDAFDELLDRDVARRLAGVGEGSADESERLAAEADELRRKVRGASEHIEALERRLRAQEEALRAAAPPSSGPAPLAGRAASADDAEQRKRMRAKLEELKAQIAEGNRERADLRKRLAEASEELAPRAAEQEDEAEPESDEDEEGVYESATDEERDVLVPVYAPNATKGIANAPPKVAREAVVLSAQLAAGDPAAWRGCKRLLKPSPPVWSARCGIHHRLLFRPSDGRLDVLELIARKDLETVLKRYS